MDLLRGLPEVLASNFFRANRCEVDGKEIANKKLFFNRKDFMAPIYFHSMFDKTAINK